MIRLNWRFFHRTYSSPLFIAFWMQIKILSLFSLAGAIGALPAYSVPVIPNESLVVGEVLELTAVQSSTLNIKPAQILFRVKLRLLSVEDVQNKANFLEAKKGQILEVYSKEKISPELLGKVIRGHISFRGDDRGGLYWIFKVSKGEAR